MNTHLTFALLNACVLGTYFYNGRAKYRFSVWQNVALPVLGLVFSLVCTWWLRDTPRHDPMMILSLVVATPLAVLGAAWLFFAHTESTYEREEDDAGTIHLTVDFHKIGLAVYAILGAVLGLYRAYH